MNTILLIFSVFFILRLGTLIFSIRNEKRIKSLGATQYGKINSTVMALLHILYYLASLYEAIYQQVVFDSCSLIGVAAFIFSYLVLLTVIFQIRDVWTVKLYIVPNHKINRNFIFKYFRHPNYFLNILPEMIAIGLLCHSWISMTTLLPFYFTTIVIRIIQEEKFMKEKLDY